MCTPSVLNNRGNDSWLVVIIPREDEEKSGVAQSCLCLTSIYATSARTQLDALSRAPPSYWLSPTSLDVPAGLPGCSCQALTQATVWIATDAPSRRPASPRATFIQPRSTKSCKWECLLCHPVIFGHFKAALNDCLTRVFLFFPDPNKGKKSRTSANFSSLAAIGLRDYPSVLSCSWS